MGTAALWARACRNPSSAAPVSPRLAPLLPASMRDTVGKFLPYIAGQAIFNTTNNNNTTLSPWAGLAVFALYATLALAIGIVLIRHRDA
jgi:ABC-2 type transport system permease protein